MEMVARIADFVELELRESFLVWNELWNCLVGLRLERLQFVDAGGVDSGLAAR